MAIVGGGKCLKRFQNKKEFRVGIIFLLFSPLPFEAFFYEIKHKITQNKSKNKNKCNRNESVRHYSNYTQRRMSKII